MYEVWGMFSVWIFLAILAALVSQYLKLATALSEIMIGILAQLLFHSITGYSLNPNEPWIKFLAGAGAIILTFLAGAEVDPDTLKTKWKEATIIGLVAFFAPFFGCTAIAYYILGWSVKSSWLAGVALSTTSIAVVYAVMLELGLNRTEFGKVILAACFINDLGTVIALGLIFAPFTFRTVVFMVISIAVFILLPHITTRFFKRYGNRPSEIEAKYLLLVLFGLGYLAGWSESEAVLPAYIAGMVLAGSVGKDHVLIRRLRTLTFGLLTPFYFLRVGSFVSIPSIIKAPVSLLVLFMGKMVTKFTGVYPVTKFYRYAQKEGMYATLLMSTGLTFGSISALFGLTHGIIDQQQYSLLIIAVILSAVIPTIIANAFYLPKYLLPDKEENDD